MERQKTLVCFILFSFVFLRPIASISKVPLTAQTSIETSSLQNRNASTDYVASQSNNASKGNSTANTTKKLHSVVLQATQRRLLQAPSSILPYAPLKVIYNGKLCILFRARKLAIRYKNHTLVDLTERAFGPEAQVDTKGSFCSKDKATLMMRFGDVEDLRGLAIRLQMSTTFYESAGQNWFTLDNVHIHYNWTHEATFNSTDVYAPATNSYHCQHVSSLPKYDTLLIPSSNTDNAANWHITFTDFQIQAFNLLSNKFAAPSDCATFFTPAILMGLITSLILLLVLAYALHMVVHLKHIDRYEEHKTTVYFPRSSEAECMDKNSL